MLTTLATVASTAALALAPPADSVDADRVMAALRALPEHRAVRGGDEDRLGIARTEALIEGWLMAMGHEVRTQEVVWPLPDRGADEPVRGQNLWIDLPGETTPDEVYVVGAHFDAVPGSPGADDNGTGVAAALEIARVLSAHRHERTIRVMFFTAEEIGLIGSRAYTRLIARPAQDAGEEQILGMVGLEMLGYFSDEENSQQSPLPAIEGVFEPPTVGDFIAVVGIAPHRAFITPLIAGMRRAATDLPIFDTGLLPVATPDMRRSDHAPFWRMGVPAVMVTDTSNFRNPHYHQPTDTIETIDQERYLMVVRAIAGAVHELAGPIGE